MATLNGLFVTTLAITYLVPVVSAVVQRRQAAALVTALGTTAEDAVVSAWNGRDFAFLDQQLPGIAQSIMLTAQQHLAYPVLHEFRSAQPGTASERTLALLDDMLTLLERGVQPPARLQPATVLVVRTAIDQARGLMPVKDARGALPPLPDVTVLAARGIPTCSPGEFATATAELAERRRHLAALVGAAAWRWPNRPAEGGGASPDGPG